MSNPPWFQYYAKCLTPGCDWIKYRNEDYSRGPKCPKCGGVRMSRGAAHRKCKEWHPEGSPCPSPYDVPKPPATVLPSGAIQLPDWAAWPKDSGDA